MAKRQAQKAAREQEVANDPSLRVQRFCESIVKDISDAESLVRKLKCDRHSSSLTKN